MSAFERSRSCSLWKTLMFLILLGSFVFILQLLVRNGLADDDAPFTDTITEYKGCTAVCPETDYDLEGWSTT